MIKQFILSYLPKINLKNISTDLYKNDHSSFLHNSPKLEKAQCLSTAKWVTVAIYSYKGILLSSKEELTSGPQRYGKTSKTC